MLARDSVAETIGGQASVLSELFASLLEPVLQTYGLSFGAFDLITAVRSAHGRASQADIARKLGIQPPTLTESVRMAVRRELLVQLPHPTDRRSKILELTPLGHEVCEKCLKRLHEAEISAMNEITAEEAAVALRVLKRANQNLLRQLALENLSGNAPKS